MSWKWSPAGLALMVTVTVAMIAACAVSTAPYHSDTRDLSAAGASDGGSRDLTAPGPCGMCAAPTPLCDVKSKNCVACLSDNDCSPQAICVMSTCMPGCSARVSFDMIRAVSGSNNTATTTIPVPLSNALLGLSFYHQGYSIDPAANAAGLVAGNAVRVTIGRL